MVKGKTPNQNSRPPAPEAPPPTPLDLALIEFVPWPALLLHFCLRCRHDIFSYFKAISRLHLSSLDPLDAVESGTRALSAIKPALSPSCHTLVTVAGLRALRFLCRKPWIRDQLHTTGTSRSVLI
jgi:hypothetical protein